MTSLVTTPNLDALRAAFADAYRGEPEGIWAAPGRVNLIGEHLDYNGGPVLPIALPQVTLVALRRRDDDELHLTSVSDVGRAPRDAEPVGRWFGRLAEVKPGAPQGWAAYPAGVVWALAQAGPPLSAAAGGIEAVFVSTVPIGAGLSSSAALECAAAIALADLAGVPTDDAGLAALARVCVRAENEVAGAPTGGMDQAASLRAQAGHALLLDTSDDSVQQVPLQLEEAGLVLLVLDTRVRHSHAGGEYGERRATCERAARVLGVRHLSSLAEPFGAAAPDLAVLDRLEDETTRQRVRHVLTETCRVRATVELLQSGRTGDVEAIGPLLNASHASLRDDYDVTCPELDSAVAAAVAAGALGARMTGGGFGGSAVALVAADRVDAVQDGVRAAAASAGHAEPAFHLAVPSPPARRLA